MTCPNCGHPHAAQCPSCSCFAPADVQQSWRNAQAKREASRQPTELDALRKVAEAARRAEPFVASGQPEKRALRAALDNLDALSKPPDPYKHKTGRMVL